MIKNHFLNKEVGAVDAIKGRLDDMTIKLHCLKEPSYTMMLMSSYGTLEINGQRIDYKLHRKQPKYCEKN